MLTASRMLSLLIGSHGRERAGGSPTLSSTLKTETFVWRGHGGRITGRMTGSPWIFKACSSFLGKMLLQWLEDQHASYLLNILIYCQTNTQLAEGNAHLRSMHTKNWSVLCWTRPSQAMFKPHPLSFLPLGMIPLTASIPYLRFTGWQKNLFVMS